MRALWLPDILRDAGLTVREAPGWKTRGDVFDDRIPVPGLVGHHTASNRKSGNNPSLWTCMVGRPDLRGPLCQLLLARDGSYDVVASGQANHAGKGYWKDWGLSANDYALSIEAENDGIGEWWSAAIMDSYAEGAAAVLDYLGKDETDFIAHFEWAPGRKIDPRGPWVQGGGGEDWWSGNSDARYRSAAAFRMRIGACMGMTVAQEQKLDRVIALLDQYFGIDPNGKAKDIRLKIDSTYIEVFDENSPISLGGRLVNVEKKLDDIIKKVDALPDI